MSGVSLTTGQASALPTNTRLLRTLGFSSAARGREAGWGLVFFAPWGLGLLVFYAVPIITSLFLSFTKYDVLRPPEFIGLANYLKAFFMDELFYSSLERTVRYALVSVPVGLTASLLLAILLNQRARLTRLFRTCFYLPHLTPVVAAAILWRFILHPEVGPVNYLLGSLGLPQPGWLTSPQEALYAIVFINLWTYAGGNTMLIFLAGLQGVPQDLYDAADVDGAGPLMKFRHVTLPMISPTFLFNLVLGVIGALKVFTLAFVATNGGPNWATWFFALHIYRNAFEYFQMGYAAALAWVFTLLVLALTFLSLGTSRRWVYYGGS
jgi:multiple sugar transport system permease protein